MNTTKASSRSSLFSWTLVAILMIFFVGGGNSWTHPLCQTFADQLKIDYSTVLVVFNSITAGLTLVFSIISGAVCGKILPYKAVAIIGLLLYTVGGLIPLVFTEWTLVVISRVIYGIGAGVIAPVAQALTMKYYKGDENARVQGWGVVLLKLGNILAASIAGALIVISWNYAFAIFGLGLIALIFTIFALPMDEVEVTDGKSTEEIKEEKRRNRFPLWCYVWPMIVFFGYLFYMPVLQNMSAMVVGTGIGDVSMAVMASNLGNFAGIAAGLILGSLAKVLGKYLQAFMFLFTVIGMLMLGYVSDLTVILAGALLAGFGFNCITAMTLAEAARHIPAIQGPYLAGLCLALVNVVGTITPFVMQFEYAAFRTVDPFLPVQIGAWGFALLTVLIWFFQWRNKADKRGISFLRETETAE